MANNRPKVSICVPNLNTRPYLPERFDTIFNQTFQDWELIVYDSYSDDGAWEYIQELAAREPRMRISQGPREGTPGSWNPCIRQAQGEYVYVATSDDTMTSDCLEKMVAALESHPKVDLAHCCATFIDENSRPIEWKWETWLPVKYFGEGIKREHIRAPGHDTVLSFILGTPYFSITQLLIRRSLFDKAGYFEKRWGSFGDLEWQMRATLFTSTIHIPEHLATWRVHPQQATQLDRHITAVRDGVYVRMVRDVINFSKEKKVPTAKGLPRRLQKFPVFVQMFELWRHLPGCAAKIRFLVQRMFSDPRGTFWFILDYSKQRSGRKPALEREAGYEIQKIKIESPIMLSASVKVLN